MKQQERRTWAEISLPNLEHNYRALRALLPEGCRFLGVVKADAYGHGAVPVARKLEELGAEYLAVACLAEARELREAGVRLPGAMGNTIGIVGGLIIGQAAVDANIVSPMVVIVVAFTALCSFAIPNEDFATAFRLLKFVFIGLSAALGFYGFLLGLLILLIHLAQLESFGMPYLMPFVGADLNDYRDERDSLVRPPLQALTHRPFYANPKNRVRLRMKYKNR